MAKKTTFYLAITTLLFTIIASIPSFLSLDRKESKVYYSHKTLYCNGIQNIEEDIISGIIKQNNFSPNALILQIINCGNSQAEQIKFSIELPGSAIKYNFIPSLADNPVWVKVAADTVFGANSGVFNVVKKLEKLAPNRILIFYVTYNDSLVDYPSIELYSDGKAGEYIENILDAPKWNPYSVFYLPGFILGTFLIIILLWNIGYYIRKKILLQKTKNAWFKLLMDYVRFLEKSSKT